MINVNFRLLGPSELLKDTKLLSDFACARTEITFLLKLINAYHWQTYNHSINVANLSKVLAAEIGLCEREICNITLGALLHDIGKIKVDTAILNKPGSLTQSEWNIIKKHPKLGVSLLSKYDWSSIMLPLVEYHHEKIDGSGYYGLKGENIALGAKIISMADAFDAMSSPRPYQKARSSKRCFDEIKRNCGTQFDISLVSPFEKIVLAQ